MLLEQVIAYFWPQNFQKQLYAVYFLFRERVHETLFSQKKGLLSLTHNFGSLRFK
jgi:hypothetical protein